MIALDSLLDTLPGGLVSEPARKHLRQIGDQLPDALAGRIGLEARLHDENSPVGTGRGFSPRSQGSLLTRADHDTVDLLLLVSTERQLAVLAGTDSAVVLPTHLQQTPAWQGAARLARRSQRLLRGGGPIPPAIWLEFDAAGTSLEQPPLVPGLFTAAAPDPQNPAAQNWNTLGTIDQILVASSTDPVSSTLAAAIGNVVDSALTVRQVGLFPGRAHRAVRLFCAVERADRLTRTLTGCGWNGPVEEVTRWAAFCAGYSSELHLDLDVTAEGVRPAIGLEISLSGTPQPAQDPRWAELFSQLVEAGSCAPAKASALLELGTSYDAPLLPPRRYKQGLHHLKLTVSAEGTTTAKAYFGAYDLASVVSR
jgi:hypothetical protein